MRRETGPGDGKSVKSQTGSNLPLHLRQWYNNGNNYTTRTTGNSFLTPENHYDGFSLPAGNQLPHRREIQIQFPSFMASMNPYRMTSSSNLDLHGGNNTYLSPEALYQHHLDQAYLLESQFNRLNLSSQNPMINPQFSPLRNNSLIHPPLIHPQSISRLQGVQAATAAYDHQYSHNNGSGLRSLNGSYDLEIPIHSIDWSTGMENTSNYNCGRNNIRRGSSGSPFGPHHAQYHNHCSRSCRGSSNCPSTGLPYFLGMDQNGGRTSLRKRFKEMKPEEIEWMFVHVKDRVCELMSDVSRYYIVQEFVEVCNEMQISQLLINVVSDVRVLENVCFSIHGTRAMQGLLQHLTTDEQRALVVSTLSRITVPLTKDTNGHHVIEHCIKFFPAEQVQPIVNVVVDNCYSIAIDKSGCCVLQQCVAHADETTKHRLLDEIAANALSLSENAFGNYVVQFALGMGIKEVTANILTHLSGSFVILSMNKYGSNVVEKCLKESDEDKACQIIREIVHNPSMFLSVVQHPFGNYVAQSALALSKGTLRETMINLIQKNYAFLHSHPHGKRLLAQARGSRQQRMYNRWMDRVALHY